MKRTLCAALLGAAALIACADAAAARDWIVAPYGKDGAAGTAARPLKSVASALDRAAPGDSILLRGGVHDVGGGVWVGPQHSGRAGAPLRIAAYRGERPEIVGPKGDCVWVDADWVIVEGLTCYASGWNGIGVWGRSNVVIRDNRVIGTHENGIATYPNDSGRKSTRILIENNEVAWTGERSKAPKDRIDGGWPQGINLYGDDITARGNRVHHTWGEGIGCRGVRCAIVANRVATTLSVGIYLDGAQSPTVRRNFVAQDGNEAFERGLGGGKVWRRATGIQVAAEDLSAPLKNVEISNNVVVGAAIGIYYGDYGTNPGLDGARVLHNTIVDPIEAALNFEGVHGRGVDILGNVFYRRDQGRLGVGHKVSGVSLRGNAWYGQTLPRMRGQGDVTKNPRFQGGPWDRPESYRLRQRSPLVDRAPASGVAVDFTAMPRGRGGAPDIGAFERRK